MSSTWVSIRDKAEKIAPWLVGALNPAAGSILAMALGTDNTPEAVGAAMESDPQAREKIMGYEVQLKQIAANQAVADHQADVALQQSDASDRQSARLLATAKGFWPQIGISLVFLGGYFVLMGCITTGFVNIPAPYHDLAVTLIGVLTAGVPQILNFWLGSTHGSQKKDAALTQAALSD